MNAHRTHGTLDVIAWIFRSERERFFERHSVWNVPVQRIMRAGLIGKNIRNDTALHDFRKDIRAVADETN